MTAAAEFVDVEALAPYRGLTPFGDSDLDVLFFFGRDREREIITANLMASRLTVLYGETGVGKSSVLRAGVAYQLRKTARENLAEIGEAQLAVVFFDQWRDDPVEALATTVAASMRETLGEALDPPLGGARLTDQLHAWTALLGGDLYLILDQAEEFFLYHDGEEGEGTFVDELPELVGRSGLRVNVLISLREDTVAKLDRFKARIPNLFANYLRLEHLDRAAASEAIIGPLEQFNRLVEPDHRVKIEPPLAEAVLDELAAGTVDLGQAGRGAVEVTGAHGRIETPYLQLVMERLWETEREAGSPLLRLSTFRELGGAQRIVEAHLERALDALTEPERDIAASMLDHLVTPSGTKIAHAAPDLATWAHVDESALLPVLTKLGTERILRSVPAANGAGGQRYEIFHDVLADGVLGWKSGHQAQRELTAQREQAEKRQRRLLRVIAGGALLLLLMVAVTVFALVQRSDARSQARLAHARELAATAVSQLPVDPQTSLRLAMEAAGLKRTRQVEDVLRQALIQSRERAILRSGAPVRSVAFSPDGSLVLTASDDGTARIWPIGGGHPVRTLKLRGPLAGAAFSPDGSLVLTAGVDGVRLWNPGDGTPSRTFTTAASSGAVFGSNGSLVAAASANGVARVWQTEMGKLVLAARHRGSLLGVALSPDGSVLLAVGADPDGTNLRARLYEVGSGRLLRTLGATGVTSASFSPDGTRVVTASEDHTAAIWRVEDGRRLHLFAEQRGGVTSASFGPGGHLVVTTSSDGATRVWNARTGARVALMLGHVNAVNSAAFSRDGRFLITVSSDGTARVWEAATGRPEATLRGHTDSVLAGAFSPDGRTVVTAGADGTARIWDPGTAPELRLFSQQRGPVLSAAIGPDGRVLDAGEDGTIRIFAPDARLLRVLRWRAVRVSFDPGGKLVAGGGPSGVRVWDAASGTVVRTTRYSSPVADVAYGADGGLVVAEGRQVHSAGGRHVLTQPSPVASTAVSPDGKLIATAGEDGTARIWNARTGALLHVLRGHKDAVTSVEFSRDGNLLVTASRDHDARIWDVAGGRPEHLLRGHFGPVFGASFSPDGRWVVTAGPTTGGLWDALTGRLMFYLRGHTEALTAALFSPDGRRILTASRDGSLRIYRCELCGEIDELMALAKARLARLRS